jgi:hypothetical protein
MARPILRISDFAFRFYPVFFRYMVRPHFKLPLNISHAAQVSTRIRYHLHSLCVAEELTGALVELLDPWREADSNPGAEEAARLVERAASLGRRIVDEIVRAQVGHDRLGQSIRNLFECLGLGEEGAEISLKAGENPDSLLRPT